MVEQRSLWRSEPMCRMKLQMPREDVHDTIVLLGQLGVVQFNDNNLSLPPLHRVYVPHLRRCEELERRIEYFRAQISESEAQIRIHPFSPNGSVTIKTRQLKKGMLETLELQLEKTEMELRDLTSKYESMLDEMNKQKEMREVFSLENSFYMSESTLKDEPYERVETSIFRIVGVIPKNSLHLLEKITYRITRGNSYIRDADIQEPFVDPRSSARVQKSVFVIFFAASLFLPKITKVCESLEGHIYPYSELDPSKILPQVISQCEIMTQAIQQTKIMRNEILLDISLQINSWSKYIKAEKLVYEVLNQIDLSGMIAIADIWIPQCEIEEVERTLYEADIFSNAQVSSILSPIENEDGTTDKNEDEKLRTPPTFFRTSKYSAVFQDIVDSYGIARYQEINPAVLSASTFPYLFGIMYGDMGHGLILAFSASMLIAFEKRLTGSTNEILNTIFHGRYLVLLMGMYSFYIGMLYNDTFGISTDIFPSGYVWGTTGTTEKKMISPIDPSGIGKGRNIAPLKVSPFGIDFAWAETENKLEFYNSIKMKCAIVIGVVQMFAGLILSLMNHVHFKDWRRVFFQFIPEFVFLLCTFGYMAILIIVKWCTPFLSTHDAPSLLENMTNFFLAPGNVTIKLYRGQSQIQVILLLLAFLMIPLMLIPIPYLTWKDNRRRCQSNAYAHEDGKLNNFLVNSHCFSHTNVYESEDLVTNHPSSHDHEIDLSEVCIHQIIHTIEFVLGAVSNTASYLRLWALSLAHAELSDVFWNFTIVKAIAMEGGSGIFTFIGTAVWLLVSIFVLLMMESLSAFLHTLRLHWVEFQNKFYYGDGNKFIPFDLTDITFSQ